MRKKKYKADDNYGFEELIEDDQLSEAENLDLDDDETEQYSRLGLLPIESYETDVDVDDIEEVDNLEVEEIVDKKQKKSLDKKKFYVDPKEFDTEIMNYYDSGHITDNLAQMISKISNKLSFASNFINYSYREEMAGDGIIRMMKALIAQKYNREKGTNPFSYFTRIAFNAFRNRIKKEKHIHETHEKYREELTLLSSNYNNIVKNKNSTSNKNFN